MSTVGDLGPGGEHEPPRDSVRARTSGRDLHGLDARGGKDRVERVSEQLGAVADQELEARHPHRLIFACPVLTAARVTDLPRCLGLPAPSGAPEFDRDLPDRAPTELADLVGRTNLSNRIGQPRLLGDLRSPWDE
jgi:hypothetical protein